jgi:hypothetical protein
MNHFHITGTFFIYRYASKLFIENDISLICPGILTRDAPDTVFAGYPANPKAGYPVDIWPAGYQMHH